LDKKIAIEKITVGALQTNCYLVINKELEKSVLIDAAAQGKLIQRKIARSQSSLEAIVITHGHADHIGALDFFDVPIYIHEKEVLFLKDADRNLSAFFGSPLKVAAKKEIRGLHDGQTIEIAGFNLKILQVPGHTPGSICLYFNSILFSGDALFAGSIGRTDLPYGSTKELVEAIKNKLLILPDNTLVYPGHGPSSTIGEEKQHNPFLT